MLRLDRPPSFCVILALTVPALAFAQPSPVGTGDGTPAGSGAPQAGVALEGTAAAKEGADLPISSADVRERGDGAAALPPLAELLALAGEKSPGIIVAQAGYKASQAARVGAQRLPLGNPLVTVWAERGDNNATQDVMIDGTVELPLQIWGQRGKRIAEAEAFVRASEASVGVARSQTLADLILAYGQVVVALERETVLLDAITAAKQEQQVFDARLQLKDATLRDARLSTMEVARNEVLLSETRADVQVGLTTIHRLTARLYAPGPTSEHLIPPPPPGNAPAASAGAPQVKEARALSDYYGRASERAAAEGTAPLSLIFRFGRGDLADTRWGGGLSIGLPFFQRNQGEVALAQAQAERARVLAENTKDLLSRTAEGLIREFDALTIARRTLEDLALPAARDAVDQAEQIQKAGKSDLLPILVSRRDYAALRLRRLDILARQWRLLGEVVRLTGELP